MISDLLHLTRESSTTNHEPLDLATITAAALDRARRRDRGVTFDAELHSLRLQGDAAVLERAVSNLLDNAVQWGPPAATVHVRLSGRQLVVADEGPGIASSDLAHIFDRFYRAEAARSTPGTGLGLAIAARAARDHSGTIYADRSPWGGARFTLTLPGAPARPTSAGPAASDSADASPARSTPVPSATTIGSWSADPRPE